VEAVLLAMLAPSLVFVLAPSLVFVLAVLVVVLPPAPSMPASQLHSVQEPSLHSRVPSQPLAPSQSDVSSA
jgi:hypothetical protein